MEKEELKILEELRRILNSKNEAIVILNNYFKGGVGKSKLSTMFAYLTDKFKMAQLCAFLNRENVPYCQRFCF